MYVYVCVCMCMCMYHDAMITVEAVLVACGWAVVQQDFAQPWFSMSGAILVVADNNEASQDVAIVHGAKL